MTTIIVGADLSDEGADALALAAWLADALAARLVVGAANEHEPRAAPGITYPESMADYFGAVERRARERLGDGFDWRELRDSAAHGLHELAEREGADLIVLGSTHRGALGRVYPGSVADRLLAAGPCAIAVAPRGYGAAEHAGMGILAVGFDGRPESERALAEARRYAAALGMSLRVVAAAPPAAPGVSEPDEVAERLLRARLDDAVARLPAPVEVDAVVEVGRAADVLAAHGVEADLLVLGARGYGPIGRTLLGGVSSEVVRTAPCPVLVVPRGTDSAP